MKATMDNKILLPNTTLCLTIGKRPNELSQSLPTLLSKIAFKRVIAINDFGDEATNEVFKHICPKGELIDIGQHLGHHKAVDLMYSKVDTPYIFHSEDDWVFDSLPDFSKMFVLLNQNDSIVSVCFRKIDDFLFTEDEALRIDYKNIDDIDIADLTPLHDQWHGYTFNPHLIKKSVYDELAPFASYKKERHISRIFRRQAKYVAYLKNGCCHHIGFESVANPPKIGFWNKLKAKIFG